ncbi:MAG: hypothetical protein AAFP19_02120 [Bacteroidota bacterium]
MKYLKIHLQIFALLLALFSVACDNDSADGPSVPPLDQTTIWSGPTVTFEKAANADPALEENQDRITNDVWLTRGNEGGQIYNAVTETSADKDDSPEGTLWAVGTTANLQNLDFKKFRTTLEKPRENIGIDLVLLLVDENIAIDIKITKWSQNMQGGFAIERSSN